MVKTPTGYFPPSCGGGGGVKNRPVARGSAKSSFFGHKMGQNCVILVGLGLGPYFRKLSSKSFLVQMVHCFCGGPTPFQNKSWLWAWWKDCATCCCRVKNSAVNRKSVERALFCFCFVFSCFWFVFFCLFVCLFDWFF